MQTLIDNASSSFSATTGFSWNDIITWAITQLKTILGAGLGFAEALLPIIIAVVLVGVAITVLYMGLRYLHILR